MTGLVIAVAIGYPPRPPDRNADRCRKVALRTAHTGTPKTAIQEILMIKTTVNKVLPNNWLNPPDPTPACSEGLNHNL